MATEENSGFSMRAGLLGQAAPEQRIEMQQKSGLKELVMSVCPITTLKPTKDIKIMNKTSSSLCLRRHSVTVNPIFNTKRQRESYRYTCINVSQ